MTAAFNDLPDDHPPAAEPRAVHVFVCGERHRGDDALAFAILERLPATLRSRVTIVDDGDLDATALIGMPDDARCVIVDAVKGVGAGEIVQVPLPEIAMAMRERVERGVPPPPHSSHSMPIEGTLALVALLMGAPIEGTFVGIGVSSCNFGEPLSPAIEDALPRAVDVVVETIERHLAEVAAC